MYSYLFCADLFCADLCRGGKNTSPVEYDQLLQLHTNCVKENTDGAAKPSHNFGMDTGLFGSYVKFQAVYKARIDHLKAGQFEEPSVAGQEICVPPLLLKFSQKLKANSAQPVGNYSARTSSCAFSPARYCCSYCSV